MSDLSLIWTGGAEITAIGCIFLFLLGSVVGSFLNVCIHRAPREESIVWPPSHCPLCGARIRPYDNVPLLSYAFLRGKCRACGGRISSRYPLVEGLTAVFFVLLFLRFGPGEWGKVLVPIYAIFVCGLIVSTFVDFSHQIIPNAVTFPGMALGPLLSLAFPVLMGETARGAAFVRSLGGLLLGGGLLWVIAAVAGKVLKKEAMGMGDVKLLAMVGAFLGWEGTLLTLILSSFIGSAVAVVLMLKGSAGWQTKIPYGPYLCAGAAISLFWGGRIIEGYMKIAGLVQ